MGGNLGYSKGALARRGGGWIDAYLPKEMRVTRRTYYDCLRQREVPQSEGICMTLLCVGGVCIICHVRLRSVSTIHSNHDFVFLLGFVPKTQRRTCSSM